MKKPRISVVISNYNDGLYIDEALTAIGDQIEDLAEIILIDDCSTDDSVSMMTKFAGRTAKAKCFKNESRKGVIANYNYAQSLVSTELVYFASSNDRVLPGLFSTGRDLMVRYPEAGLFSALVQYMSETGRREEIMQSPWPLHAAGYLSPEQARRFLWREGEWVIGNTTIYRTARLRELGGFDPRLFGACDGFAAATITCCYGACFVPKVLGLWRRNPAGYASLTLRDMDKSRSVMETGASLIEACPNAFPRGYAKRWRKRWLFAIASRGIGLGSQKVDSALAQLMQNRLMSGILDGLRRNPRMAKIALFLWLRPYDLLSVLKRRFVRRSIAER